MNPIGDLASGPVRKASAELTAAVSSPSLVFWLTGALAWLYSSGPSTGLDKLEERFGSLSTSTTIVAVGIAVGLLLASSWLGAVTARSVIKLLEGYWPPSRVLRPLRDRLAERQRSRRDRLNDEWKELETNRERNTPSERDRRVKLELTVARFPVIKERTMPTRVGNTLKAAEERPLLRYGLDPVITWPVFALVIPTSALETIRAKEASLLHSAGFVFWFALAVSWSWLTWWCAAVAVVGALLSYYGLVLPAARNYAVVTNAVMAVHWKLLYPAVGLPEPSDPVDPRGGDTITSLLLRGMPPGG